MTSFCSYFDQGQCRSCEWIETSYSTQIAEKEKLILKSLGEYLALSPSVQGAERAFRNRAKMTVTGTVDNPVIGLVGEMDLDSGRELLHCPIHHPRLNELIASLPKWIGKYNLYPYSIREKKGELKGLIAFYSPLSQQMYLRFILRSKDCVSRLIKMLPEIQSSFPDLVCISANLQPIAHAILEGPEEIILTPKKMIDHQFASGLMLQLAPQAFVQTNFEVASKLYQTAADWIAKIHPERMLELFCGQGAFSFFAAKSAKNILGIEINPDAVATANQTAKQLHLDHLRFQCADASQIGSEMKKFAADLILVNPPRRGLGEAVKQIEEHRPENLIYSSCAIETLASDLKKLSSQFELERVQLFDLFPHTSHFETLVWLKRR